MTESIIAGIIIVALILFGVYAAYFFGYLTFTSHASVLYVGNIKCARFLKCNGIFKRIIRLDGCQTYYFQLVQSLTDGEISVEILDKRKESVLTLNEQNTCENLYSAKKSRYCLIVRIKKASGNYELNWKRS